MTRNHEHVCADCGHHYPTETMTEVDEEHHLCEACDERRLLDHLVPERRPSADEEPTRPTGDPGEAGRSDAA